MQLGNRYVFEGAAHPANKMLMRIHIRVEPSDRSWGAYLADQVLVFEKLQSSIDSSLRQTGQLLAQPAVDRFGCRMSEIFGKRPIDRQPLSGDSDTPLAAEPLEFRAPAVDFTAVTGRHFIAADYHLRIIII